MTTFYSPIHKQKGFATTVKYLRDKYSKTAPQGFETYESTCGNPML